MLLLFMLGEEYYFIVESMVFQNNTLVLFGWQIGMCALKFKCFYKLISLFLDDLFPYNNILLNNVVGNGNFQNKFREIII